MFKLANQVIDAYDDVARLHMRKIAAKNSKITMMSAAEKMALGDHDFALTLVTKQAQKLNKFPVDCHDNTWLSNEYFGETHQRLSKEAASIAAYHIKKACEKFNIEPSPSVEGMAKEASSNVCYEKDLRKDERSVKTARLNTADLSEVQKIGDNYTFAQYAFRTPSHIKMACQYFDKFSKDMPVDYRHKYAAAIQRRANELGMGAQKGTVVKYASDHYSGMVDAHLSSRKTLLEVADPKFTQALTKLAGMKKELTPTEFARVLHGFDKKAGLEKYYGGYLTDPYQATFAEEPDPYGGWRTKVAGMEITPDQLKEASHKHYDKIKTYFGKDVANELKKHGAPIFESLPKDAKEVIANIVHGQL